MTDHLHNSVSEMIAAAVVAQGGSASARSMSRTRLLAELHNAITDDPDLSAATTSQAGLLAAIHNVISDGADRSHLTSSVTELLASIAGVSALSVSEGRLWELAMSEAGSFTPVEGGGGDENAVTFMGDPVTIDGDPVVFTPPE